MKSFLARDRILFVGYSLGDPDLMALRDRIALNLPRAVPSMALLPNASDDDLENWASYHNIDVLSYRAQGGDHSELHTIFEATSKVLALGQEAPVRKAPEDLRKLQALYLWHRFAPSRTGEAPVDALQSVILRIILDQGGTDLSTLLVKLDSEVSLSPSEFRPDIEAALQRLVSAGWLECGGDTYLVPDSKRLTILGYDRRFADMMSVFRQQALFDMGGATQIPETIATRLTDAAIDALIDIFEIRGQEIVGMVSEDAPRESDLLDLMEVIWRRANTLDSAEQQHLLVRFLLDLLSRPEGIYVSVLDYLARAFFCIQALRIDPNVSQIVAGVISDRALVIDANVLIPLTAQHEERHGFVKGVLEVLGKVGLPLYTTEKFLEEVRRHLTWAWQLADDFGAQSVEVLQASRGEGRFYDANAYLRGFINWTPQHGYRATLRDYFRFCFDGPYSRARLESFLDEKFGIKVVPEPVIEGVRAQNQKQYDNCIQKVAGWTANRPAQRPKKEQRIESEVETFLLVTNWGSVHHEIHGEEKRNCTYLTLGSSFPGLRRLAKVQGGLLWLFTAGNLGDPDSS